MIIETKRLLLRSWCEKDIDALVDGLGNFNVAKNMTVPFPYTKKEAIEFLNYCNSNKNRLHFAVTLKETGEVIGGTSLEKDTKIHGGIWLNEKYIGKGYGTEVWVARAKFGFEVLGASELINGFFDFNERSWHMQQKVGYKQIGEKQNYSPALKKEVREIVTSLKEEDFYRAVKKLKNI